MPLEIKSDLWPYFCGTLDLDKKTGEEIEHYQASEARKLCCMGPWLPAGALTYT
jgi:hypothetical protein